MENGASAPGPGRPWRHGPCPLSVADTKPPRCMAWWGLPRPALLMARAHPGVRPSTPRHPPWVDANGRHGNDQLHYGTIEGLPGGPRGPAAQRPPGRTGPLAPIPGCRAGLSRFRSGRQPDHQGRPPGRPDTEGRSDLDTKIALRRRETGAQVFMRRAGPPGNGRGPACVSDQDETIALGARVAGARLGACSDPANPCAKPRGSFAGRRRTAPAGGRCRPPPAKSPYPLLAGERAAIRGGRGPQPRASINGPRLLGEWPGALVAGAGWRGPRGTIGVAERATAETSRQGGGLRPRS